MSRFFIPTDNIDGNIITVCGSDAHHISHVLRMAKNDRITVCDMARREHECIIRDFTKDTVILEIVSSKESTNEPSVNVTLYQGLPKADKFEQIIQKAVELGVGSVVPVEAERSVVKVNDGFHKKLDRYNAISLAAAKQCGRAIIPNVGEPIRFTALIDRLKAHGCGFICYEGKEVIPIRNIIEEAKKQKTDDFGFYIGPEGGLSEKELELAEKSGIKLCGLGSRILRTETASGCVLSCIMLLTENLQ